MTPAVIITGALGGIGQALCEEFHSHGFHVFALDRKSGTTAAHTFICGDVRQIVSNLGESAAYLDPIRLELKEKNLTLRGIINNAAAQILGSTATLSYADWEETLQTNLMAPFLAGGAVVNISSIHEKLTKPGFVAYATSKSALSGLTRAMAVDLAGRVRVNAICPAAIHTPMLAAGFAEKPDALAALHYAHPTGRIGLPEEVAHLARYLVAEAPDFLNGSCLGLDGGIAGRLHDPV